MVLDQPVHCLFPRWSKIRALIAQCGRCRRAIIGKALFEAGGTGHGFGEKAGTSDVRDALVALAGQISAHGLAAAEVVDLDAIYGVVGQVADEYRRHVELEQLVMHPVQSKISDN